VNEPESETLARFMRRFAAIEGIVPDPPPIDLQHPTQRGRKAPAVLPAAYVLIGVLVVLIALRPDRAPGGSPPASDRPSGTGTATASPEAASTTPPVGVATSPGAPTSSLTGSLGRWRVDVVNNARTVLVQIDAESAVYAWEVPAGARFTLIDDADAQTGHIWIRDLASSGNSCAIIAEGAFEATSFTIMLNDPAGRPYEMTLTAGSTTTGGPNTSYDPACSG
jgi:hypothetical protein